MVKSWWGGATWCASCATGSASNLCGRACRARQVVPATCGSALLVRALASIRWQPSTPRRTNHRRTQPYPVSTSSPFRDVALLRRAPSPTVGQVVVASSDKAYGDQDSLPYTEETPLQGRTPRFISLSRTSSRTPTLPLTARGADALRQLLRGATSLEPHRAGTISRFCAATSRHRSDCQTIAGLLLR